MVYVETANIMLSHTRTLTSKTRSAYTVRMHRRTCVYVLAAAIVWTAPVYMNAFTRLVFVCVYVMFAVSHPHQKSLAQHYRHHPMRAGEIHSYFASNYFDLNFLETKCTYYSNRWFSAKPRMTRWYEFRVSLCPCWLQCRKPTHAPKDFSHAFLHSIQFTLILLSQIELVARNPLYRSYRASLFFPNTTTI